MYISFIHPTWPDSEGTGATYSATQIVSGLAERGNDVVVYCLQEPPRNATIDIDVELRTLDVSGFPYHTQHQLNDAITSRRSEFEAFDVTHCYQMAALPALETISQKTSTATAVTLNAYKAVCPKNDLRYHNQENCSENGLFRCTGCILATNRDLGLRKSVHRTASRLGSYRMVQRGLKYIDAIDGFHALSGRVRDIHDDFGVPADKMYVIPNILNESFIIDHKSDFELPLRLLYVGYLKEHKGVTKLIEIANQLQTEPNIEFEMTVVGTGEKEAAMKFQTQRFGLEDEITFTGRIPNSELPEVYASHDVFVYPGNWHEPFGRVFLESLAAGTPVIASDVGSVRDIIGKGGITVDGSVESFVEQLVLASESLDLQSFSEMAREKVREYRAERVIDMIEDMYREISS